MRAMAGGAALTLLVLVGLDLPRSVIGATTAPLRVTARRVVLLLAQPVILLVTIPVSARFGSGLLHLAGVMLPLAIVSLVLNLALSPLAGNIGELMTGIGVTAILIAGAAAAGALHLLLRRAWVGGPLKVVLDIVRYMGDPTHRARVQGALDARIGEARTAAGDGRQIALVAHSLGSVIALDSLVNSAVWQPSDTVVLITMGSPIRRFFVRFFPGYLFPPSVERAARLAASRVRALTWINVHRRWDYVGTGLNLGRAGVGADVCTGQWRRVRRAHSNYWEDPLVIDRIRQWLPSVTPAERAGGNGETPPHAIPSAPAWPLSIRLARAVRTAAVWLIAVVVLVGVFTFVRSRVAWGRDTSESVAVLASSGTLSAADVTYHRTTEGSGDEAYELHHFVFRIAGLPDALPPIEIADNVVYDARTRRFAYKALADYVLDDCARTEEKPWWQILRRTVAIPCTRTGVAVRYDPADPASFVLPDFPSRSGWRDVLGEAIATLVLAVFFGGACWLVVVGGAVPLFRLFLGLEAVDRSE
jgi:hypothetical protein